VIKVNIWGPEAMRNTGSHALR